MPPGPINSPAPGQPEAMAQVCRRHPVSDRQALETTAVAWILAAADAAIRARQQFHLVLAGGDTPRGVYRQLRHASTDWLRWYLYFGDERCLPPHDPGLNASMAAAAWLDHVSIPTSHIQCIPVELGTEPAANAYVATLRAASDFDLVLLGLGEDGHTASLFPGHAWGTAADAVDVLSVHNAPKPPPERITLSANRLGRARQVLFLVGPGKENALADWRAGKDIPARSIAPVDGVDILFVAGAS